MTNTPRTDAVCKQIENLCPLIDTITLDEFQRLMRKILELLRENGRQLERELAKAKARIVLLEAEQKANNQLRANYKAVEAECVKNKWDLDRTEHELVEANKDKETLMNNLRQTKAALAAYDADMKGDAK